MSAARKARRDAGGFGGSAASKRALPPAGTAGTGPADIRCLKALIVAVKQASDVRQWYTATKELRLASFPLCEVCRSTHTVHIRVGGGIPTTLLAAMDAPRANREGGVYSRVPRLRARRVTWELTSLNLLSSSIDTWAEVEELYFSDAFNGRLKVRAWPRRLRKIKFGVRANFDQPIVGVAWPASLQELEFGYRFNQVIEGVAWPPSLQELNFRYQFNQPIDGLKLPPSLQKLTFLMLFKQPIDQVKWPAFLQHLDLGHAFNWPIESIRWPESLLQLHFGGGFNQPIEGVTWPGSLQQLSFRHKFNQPIDTVRLPASLRSLTFGMLFNRPIDRVTWPPSLEELTFGDKFNKPVSQCKFPSLRRLSLTGTFSKSLGKLGRGMPALERLTLRLGSSPARYAILRGIEWPTGLTHLTVSRDACLDGIAIPIRATVVHDDGLGWRSVRS